MKRPMLDRWRGWFIAGSLVVSGAAFAQQAGGIQVMPAPDGIHVSGSITVGGVTYTADEILAMAQAFAQDSGALPADAPQAVRDEIVKLAGLLKSAGGHP